jgi:hypothetical protein
MSILSGKSLEFSKLRTEELLLQNYEDLIGLIQHFGMGILIFPSLVHELNGSYSISVKNSENLDNS